MSFLKNIPWKRVIVILFGAGGVVEALGGSLPPTWQAPIAAIGGLVGGIAINAEKIVAKRKTPSNPFDSVDAATKVERMK